MAGLSEAEKLNGIVTGVKDHYNEIVKNESASGGESIKPFCVDGAIMQCTMGSASGKLTVIDHGVAITGKYAAHDEDRVPGTNIPSFGTCAATGKPCAPSPVPKWLLTDEFSLMTNKRGAAATSAENCALITDSILVCMQGGIIKFVTSGQMMTVGDLLEMLKALFEAMQKGSGGTGNEGKKPAFTGDDGSNQGKVPPGGYSDEWKKFESYKNEENVDLSKDDEKLFEITIPAENYRAADGIFEENGVSLTSMIQRILFHECETLEDQKRLAYLLFNKSFLKEFSSRQNLIDAVRQSGGNEIYEKGANSPGTYLTDDKIQELINLELLPNQYNYEKAQEVLEKIILNLPSPYDVRKKERVNEMLIAAGYQVDRFTKNKDDATELYYNSVKLAKAVTVCRNNTELSDREKRELAMLLIAPDFEEQVTYTNSNGQSITVKFDDVKEFITWQASQSGGGRKYIFCDGQEGSNKYRVAEEYFDWETGKLNEKGKEFKENELQQSKNKRKS